MSVSAVAHPSPSSVSTPRALISHQQRPAKDVARPGTSALPTPAATHDGQAGDVKGAVRLLEAGHFKGVADVRLRINFFDELSTRAADRAASTIPQNADDLTAAVTARADEWLEPFLTDEESRQAAAELVGQFEEAIHAAASGATTAESFDADTLAASLRSAFDALTTQLASLLAAPVDEPAEPTEAPPPADPLADAEAPDAAPSTDAPATSDESTAEPPPTDSPSTPTLDDALALLRQAFDDALASLLGAADAVSQLPPLSPPSGKGAAYDKFLAIYNAVLDPPPTTDQSG